MSFTNETWNCNLPEDRGRFGGDVLTILVRHSLRFKMYLRYFSSIKVLEKRSPKVHPPTPSSQVFGDISGIYIISSKRSLWNQEVSVILSMSNSLSISIYIYLNLIDKEKDRYRQT